MSIVWLSALLAHSAVAQVPGDLCEAPVVVDELPFSSTFVRDELEDNDDAPGCYYDLAYLRFSPDVSGPYRFGADTNDFFPQVTEGCDCEDGNVAPLVRGVYPLEAGLEYTLMFDTYSSTPDVSVFVEQCVPQCEGRVCGADGCGGTCGDCGEGEVCRESSGQCEDRAQPGQDCETPFIVDELPFSVALEPSVFDEEVCVDSFRTHEFVFAFTPEVDGRYQVAGRESHSVFRVQDSCECSFETRVPSATLASYEQSGTYFDLDAGQTYTMLYSVERDAEDITRLAPLEIDLCVPDCDGKTCGDDGCGGWCGNCDEGRECGPDDTCISFEEACESGPSYARCDSPFQACEVEIDPCVGGFVDVCLPEECFGFGCPDELNNYWFAEHVYASGDCVDCELPIVRPLTWSSDFSSAETSYALDGVTGECRLGQGTPAAVTWGLNYAHPEYMAIQNGWRLLQISDGELFEQTEAIFTQAVLYFPSGVEILARLQSPEGAVFEMTFIWQGDVTIVALERVGEAPVVEEGPEELPEEAPEEAPFEQPEGPRPESCAQSGASLSWVWATLLLIGARRRGRRS